jgi:hypothetical protein
MGGYGSGRPAYRQKTEDYRSLDIYKLKRDGCLAPGMRGNLVWSRDGNEIARIGYHCTEGALELDYRVRVYGGDWEPIKQRVPLVHSDCNYGGKRIYARCPGVVNDLPCRRRVGKLFAGGRYFLCRHCYRLAYGSQSEPRHDRMLRRANKLRMALGGEPGTAQWVAPKPKGMWRRTYQRKCCEISWCENQANIGFLAKYRHLLSEGDLKLFDDLM